MKNINFSKVVFAMIGLTIAGGIGAWSYLTFVKDRQAYNPEVATVQSTDSLITLDPVSSDGSAAKTKSVPDLKKKKATAQNITPVPTPETVTVIHASQTSPVVNPTVTNRAQEINNLKTEIAALTKPKQNDADLKLARQKIEELEQRVNKLVEKNGTVEQENKELYAMLKRLSAERRDNEQKVNPMPVVFKNSVREADPLTGLVPSEKKPTVASTPATVVATSNASFVMEEIRLLAITITDNNKEVETTQAYQADQLVGNFTVKGSNAQNGTGEIIIVVTQPDGRILQKSTWETGTFQSPEGKKVYSCRLRFDYGRGETKRLSFVLQPQAFLKGNYVMQVYNRGVLIGKFVKSLS